ncbi:hypothetical protein J31TS4_40660 [Paenibacillus sp. J31TS4]|uniref:hypothetical protein n=1 Tax=Paenibacillus sp. J31TS4 TaxID=2807195 RepID=UPI001B26117C|nr:hypothetical protein [Paenibacillus sp. J31TS4]GIP40786.1 hypothetical protein J31TS4_40660 [Paenibacillus sp. J31TS4]
MSHRNWRITFSLRQLLKALEEKNQELKAGGVTVLALEDMQAAILNCILDVNGVPRDDDSADWLVSPALQMMWNELGIDECLRLMQERQGELRRPVKSG